MLASLLLLGLLPVLAASIKAEDNVRLECKPRAFEVVPGEPMRLELTLRTSSPLPLRWFVPDEPLLKLRAIEKLPVRRTREGVVVYKRVVVWQGLEAGMITIGTLSVETEEKKLLFPEVSIIVRDPTP